MSPLIAYHATRRACRDSIASEGLLPNQPAKGRPFGVYVFREDGGFAHLAWNSQSVWTRRDGKDLWEVAYIGPFTFDPYVLNGMILLETADHVTLVTGN